MVICRPMWVTTFSRQPVFLRPTRQSKSQLAAEETVANDGGGGGSFIFLFFFFVFVLLYCNRRVRGK